MSFATRFAPLTASPAMREALLDFTRAELDDVNARLAAEGDTTLLHRLQGRALLLRQIAMELTR